MGDLSGHFDSSEFLHTDSGLDNTPDSPVIYDRLVKVAQALECIRSLLGCPIHINSGYRSDAVNKKAGGSETSAHHLGLAADIIPVGLDLLDAFRRIAADPLVQRVADQLIWEEKPLPRGGFVKWIHVGIGHGPNGDLPIRHQVLIFSPKTNGAYLPFSEDLVA